ncbi:unnamed protein product [Amoebophrya sp. A120]|nr:unnamed protein product [Amoebophrya sp. A120]|eukprot:GSA120T00012738001.1
MDLVDKTRSSWGTVLQRRMQRTSFLTALGGSTFSHVGEQKTHIIAAHRGDISGAIDGLRSTSSSPTSCSGGDCKAAEGSSTAPTFLAVTPGSPSRRGDTSPGVEVGLSAAHPPRRKGACLGPPRLPVDNKNLKQFFKSLPGAILSAVPEEEATTPTLQPDLQGGKSAVRSPESSESDDTNRWEQKRNPLLELRSKSEVPTGCKVDQHLGSHQTNPPHKSFLLRIGESGTAAGGRGAITTLGDLGYSDLQSEAIKWPFRGHRSKSGANGRSGQSGEDSNRTMTADYTATPSSTNPKSTSVAKSLGEGAESGSDFKEGGPCSSDDVSQLDDHKGFKKQSSGWFRIGLRQAQEPGRSTGGTSFRRPPVGGTSSRFGVVSRICRGAPAFARIYVHLPPVLGGGRGGALATNRAASASSTSSGVKARVVSSEEDKNYSCRLLADKDCSCCAQNHEPATACVGYNYNPASCRAPINHFDVGNCRSTSEVGEEEEYRLARPHEDSLNGGSNGSIVGRPSDHDKMVVHLVAEVCHRMLTDLADEKMLSSSCCAEISVSDAAATLLRDLLVGASEDAVMFLRRADNYRVWRAREVGSDKDVSPATERLLLDMLRKRLQNEEKKLRQKGAKTQNPAPAPQELRANQHVYQAWATEAQVEELLQAAQDRKRQRQLESTYKEVQRITRVLERTLACQYAAETTEPLRPQDLQRHSAEMKQGHGLVQMLKVQVVHPGVREVQKVHADSTSAISSIRSMSHQHQDESKAAPLRRIDAPVPVCLQDLTSDEITDQALEAGVFVALDGRVVDIKTAEGDECSVPVAVGGVGNGESVHQELLHEGAKSCDAAKEERAEIFELDKNKNDGAAELYQHPTEEELRDDWLPNKDEYADEEVRMNANEDFCLEQILSAGSNDLGGDDLSKDSVSQKLFQELQTDKLDDVSTADLLSNPASETAMEEPLPEETTPCPAYDPQAPPHPLCQAKPDEDLLECLQGEWECCSEAVPRDLEHFAERAAAGAGVGVGMNANKNKSANSKTTPCDKAEASSSSACSRSGRNKKMVPACEVTYLKAFTVVGKKVTERRLREVVSSRETVHTRELRLEPARHWLGFAMEGRPLVIYKFPNIFGGAVFVRRIGRTTSICYRRKQDAALFSAAGRGPAPASCKNDAAASLKEPCLRPDATRDNTTAACTEVNTASPDCSLQRQVNKNEVEKPVATTSPVEDKVKDAAFPEGVLPLAKGEHCTYQGAPQLPSPFPVGLS